MTIEKYSDTHQIRVLNNPVAEEDEDNVRFLHDVERWLGINIEFVVSHFGAPHDPSDMLRCMKLLEAIPEIRDHFPTIAKRVPTFKGIIEQWDELAEVINRECVGEKWRAPDAYKMIKELRGDEVNHRALTFK